MSASSLGSESGIIRFARLRFVELHSVTASEASAEVFSTKRAWSDIEYIYVDGTAKTIAGKAAPKTVGYTGITSGDQAELHAVALTYNGTITDYLADARAWAEGRLSAAGFDVTEVSDDSLDLLVNMYGAYLVRLSEFSGNREKIDAYTQRLKDDSEQMLDEIREHQADVVDDSGVETTTEPIVGNYNNEANGSVFRDSAGDWNDGGKW